MVAMNAVPDPVALELGRKQKGPMRHRPGGIKQRIAGDHPRPGPCGPSPAKDLDTIEHWIIELQQPIVLISCRIPDPKMQPHRGIGKPQAQSIPGLSSKARGRRAADILEADLTVRINQDLPVTTKCHG
jgi:hypothetical protein